MGFYVWLTKRAESFVAANNNRPWCVKRVSKSSRFKVFTVINGGICDRSTLDLSNLHRISRYTSGKYRKSVVHDALAFTARFNHRWTKVAHDPTFSKIERRRYEENVGGYDSFQCHIIYIYIYTYIEYNRQTSTFSRYRAILFDSYT